MIGLMNSKEHERKSSWEYRFQTTYNRTAKKTFNSRVNDLVACECNALPAGLHELQQMADKG
jgi:hypothetical protein